MPPIETKSPRSIVSIVGGLLVAIMIVLALAACGTTSGSQTVYALDASFQALAPQAEVAIKSGRLDAKTIATIKASFQATHDALVDASKAEASGAGNTAASIAAAGGALENLTAVLVAAGVTAPNK